MIDAKITLELQKNGVQKTVHCKAGESGMRRILITLVSDGSVVDISNLTFTTTCYDSEETGTKLILENCTDKSDAFNTVIFTIPPFTSGIKLCELCVKENGTENVLYSPTFAIEVEENIGLNGGNAYDTGTSYVIVSDGSFYDKSQVDTFIGETKMLIPSTTSELENDSDFTTKAYVDELVGSSDTDLKTYVDVKFDEYDSDFVDVNRTFVDIQDALLTKASKSELVAKADKSDIPTRVSNLENDAGYLTNSATDPFATQHYVRNQIPVNVSEFVNDAGYLTKHQTLKTINGETIVGTGNIEVKGGGDGVEIINTAYSDNQFSSIREADLSHKMVIAEDISANRYFLVNSPVSRSSATFVTFENPDSEKNRAIKWRKFKSDGTADSGTFMKLITASSMGSRTDVPSEDAVYTSLYISNKLGDIESAIDTINSIITGGNS